MSNISFNVRIPTVEEQNICSLNGYHLSAKFLGGGLEGRVFVALPTMKKIAETDKLRLLHSEDEQLMVAVKIIYADHGLYRLQQLLSTLPNEINILNRTFGNPNVIKLLDVFVTGKRIFLILECAIHGTLFHIYRNYAFRQKQGFVEETQARHYFQEFLRGLESLHWQQIVHRDVKLENIFLDENENIKIGDFGLSTSKTTIASNVLLAGTPNYMAPEQFAGEACLAKPTDMWSAGILLYLLLHAHFPFEGLTFREVFEEQKKANFIAQGKETLSAECKDLLSKLLERDPNKRITVSNALLHPWMDGICEDVGFRRSKPIDEAVLQKIRRNPLYEFQEKLVYNYLNQRTALLKDMNTRISQSKAKERLSEFGLKIYDRQEDFRGAMVTEVWRLKAVNQTDNTISQTKGQCCQEEAGLKCTRAPCGSSISFTYQPVQLVVSDTQLYDDRSEVHVTNKLATCALETIVEFFNTIGTIDGNSESSSNQTTCCSSQHKQLVKVRSRKHRITNQKSIGDQKQICKDNVSNNDASLIEPTRPSMSSSTTNNTELKVDELSCSAGPCKLSWWNKLFGCIKKQNKTTPLASSVASTSRTRTIDSYFMTSGYSPHKQKQASADQSCKIKVSDVRPVEATSFPVVSDTPKNNSISVDDNRKKLKKKKFWFSKKKKRNLKQTDNDQQADDTNKCIRPMRPKWFSCLVWWRTKLFQTDTVSIDTSFESLQHLPEAQEMSLNEAFASSTVKLEAKQFPSPPMKIKDGDVEAGKCTQSSTEHTDQQSSKAEGEMCALNLSDSNQLSTSDKDLTVSVVDVEVKDSSADSTDSLKISEIGSNVTDSEMLSTVVADLVESIMQKVVANCVSVSQQHPFIPPMEKTIDTSNAEGIEQATKLITESCKETVGEFTSFEPKRNAAEPTLIHVVASEVLESIKQNVEQHCKNQTILITEEKRIAALAVEQSTNEGLAKVSDEEEKFPANNDKNAIDSIEVGSSKNMKTPQKIEENYICVDVSTSDIQVDDQLSTEIAIEPDAESSTSKDLSNPSIHSC